MSIRKVEPKVHAAVEATEERGIEDRTREVKRLNRKKPTEVQSRKPKKSDVQTKKGYNKKVTIE